MPKTLQAEALVQRLGDLGGVVGAAQGRLEVSVHEQDGGLGEKAQVGGAGLALGDEKRHGDVNGLVVEARPLDGLLVLEDDDVPSQSFFPFCKEMLDRYEHDTRITMIAGFNSDEVTEGVPDDYFFTSVFSIWGWASWRRVVDQWDEHYTFLDDPYAMQQLTNLVRQRRFRTDFIPMCRDHRASGKAFYETIFWASMLLNNGLAIMPTRNLINNMGVTTDSTHFTSSLDTIPRRLRRMFTMKRYELQFPLRHPRYVIENVAYKESVYRTNAWGHPWIKVARSLEELYRNMLHGNFRNIGRSIIRRLDKWTGRHRHA